MLLANIVCVYGSDQVNKLHDITEILLKVALNTIILTPNKLHTLALTVNVHVKLAFFSSS